MVSSVSSISVSVVSLLIAMISIQSGASLAKKLFLWVGSEGTTALRLILSAMILCAIRHPWKVRVSRKQVLPILVYGISLGLMNYLFYLAIETLPLGIAVALEFTGPLALALAFSRKPLDFLWASLAIAGIAMILPISKLSGLDPRGVIFALSAGICWAVYILSGQKAGGSLNSGVVTTLGLVIAAVIVAPMSATQAKGNLLNPEILPLALAMAFFSSALPYSLEMVALRRLPAKTFSILMSLEPIVAALMGWVHMNERLTFLQGVAIGCILVASLGSSILSAQDSQLRAQESESKYMS